MCKIVDGTVCLFRNPILLGCIRICELPFYAVFGQKGIEGTGGEFTSTICTKDFETFPSLLFGLGLPGLVLGLTEANVSVAAKIICKSDEIPISLQSGGFHWSTENGKKPREGILA